MDGVNVAKHYYSDRKNFYISYQIQKTFYEAGPYDSWEETKTHAKDISTYDMVDEVQIIVDYTPDLVISYAP